MRPDASSDLFSTRISAEPVFGWATFPLLVLAWFLGTATVNVVCVALLAILAFCQNSPERQLWWASQRFQQSQIVVLAGSGLFARQPTLVGIAASVAAMGFIMAAARRQPGYSWFCALAICAFCGAQVGSL
jgi:hypothetical protein